MLEIEKIKKILFFNMRMLFSKSLELCRQEESINNYKKRNGFIGNFIK